MIKFVTKLLLLFLLLLYYYPTRILAQTSCSECPTNGSPDVSNPGWIKGAEIKVWIDPNLSESAQRAVKQAFTNWQQANAGNNSGVTFKFVDLKPDIANENNVYLVNNASQNIYDVNGGRIRAQTGIDASVVNGYTLSAETSLDPLMTNYDAVLETMVHEIGHPAGLDHCTGEGCTKECSTQTPVVEAPTEENVVEIFNKAYGRATSPTNCDNKILQQINYPYCNPPVNCANYDVNTCLCSDFTGGGTGGGTTYPDSPGYYCTPYYWVYYESYDNGESWYMIDISYAGCW